jgi:hypothetical protein
MKNIAAENDPANYEYDERPGRHDWPDPGLKESAKTAPPGAFLVPGFK